MYALILTAALLSESGSTLSPQVRDLINEKLRADTERDIQRREAAAQQQIASQQQDEDRTNTYIIAGAVVAGVVVLAFLLASGSSKQPAPVRGQKEADDELSRVMKAWPNLSPAVRSGILAMVDATTKGSKA